MQEKLKTRQRDSVAPMTSSESGCHSLEEENPYYSANARHILFECDRCVLSDQRLFYIQYVLASL